jgi:hypothetical protein
MLIEISFYQIATEAVGFTGNRLESRREENVYLQTMCFYCFGTNLSEYYCECVCFRVWCV